MSDDTLTLGPFVLEAPIGRGATATVWKAVHRPSGTPVAVKVLARSGTGNSVRRHFATEVRAVSALDHPAIIRLHDYGDVPAIAEAGELAGSPYLVMDWHGGGTLRQARGRMPFERIRSILTTLLDALAHAHARGVIHRDLKPANVLIGESGPVIADFGLVFSPAEDRSGGVRGGTPNYMAPEQVLGDWRAYGPWTDLYAVGILAWHLATGRAPYHGQGANYALMAHVKGVLPPFLPLVELPADFEPWLRRLLARNPTDRYQYAADAAFVLDQMRSAMGDTTQTLPPAVIATDATVELPMSPDEPTMLSAVIHSEASENVSIVVPGGDDRPPMPSRWVRADRPWAAHLTGCGRALVELRQPRLHGRAEARDRLWRELARVSAHRQPRIVLIEGGPGIGKSCLMTWLSQRAHELGQARPLAVRCHPHPIPGQGIRAVLVRFLRLEALDDEQTVERLAMALGWPDEQAISLAAASRSNGRITYMDITRILRSERAVFDALADGLTALADERPVLLAIDDAHWDNEAVRFVEHVRRTRPELPILCVLTVRDAMPAVAESDAIELEDPARRAIEMLATRSEVSRVPLGPLDAATIGAMTAARLPLTTDTRDELTRLTRGNPLFADELLRFWARTDALEPRADGHALPVDRPDMRPPGLDALWCSRVEHLLSDLEPDPLPALELGAILGLDLSLSTWALTCAEAGLSRPDAAVQRLLDAGLLRASSAGRVTFPQSLMRDALTHRARGAGRSRRWHAACASALQQIDEGGVPVDPARRAGHLVAAGQAELAVPLIKAAARERTAREWHTDIRPAIALYDAVLRDRPDDVHSLAHGAICRARLSFLSAGAADGDRLAQAAGLARRAVALAPGDALAHHAMAMVHYYRLEPATTRDHAERAIALRPDSAELHALLGRQYAEIGPLDRAIRHLGEAARLDPLDVNTRLDLCRAHAMSGDWRAVDALLGQPTVDEAESRLMGILEARLALWRQPAGQIDPTAGEVGRRRHQRTTVADRFWMALREGKPSDHLMQQLEADTHHATTAGAMRRALLFEQSLIELIGFTRDRRRTLDRLERSATRGLIDLMWLTRCPHVAWLADAPRFAAVRQIVERRIGQRVG